MTTASTSAAGTAVGLTMALGAAVAMAACSVSFSTDSFGERVAGEVADQAGETLDLGEIEVDCAEPPDREPGTEFECTSTGGPGRLIWRVTLTGGDRYDAWTVNLITAKGVDQVATAVAREASRVLGRPVAPGEVDCGSGPSALEGDLELVCPISTADGVETDATVVFTDIRRTGEDRTTIETIAVEGNDATAAPVTAVQTAVALIESQAIELALGAVDVSCDDPPDQEIGTTFACVSAADAGDVRWLVLIDDVDHINAETTNLVRADIVGAVEAAVADSLSTDAVGPLGPESIDCGSGPIVLDDDSSTTCALTDPDNGQVYDALVAFSDLSTGAFSVTVADEPRR